MKSKLKVAHIICDLMAGGGQKSTIDLIRATNNQIDNYLILLEEKIEYKPDDINIISLCHNRKKYKKMDIVGDMLLAKKLKKVVDKLNIDIVISHMEVTAKIVRFLDMPKIYYMRVDISNELKLLKKKSFFRYIKRKLVYKQIFTNQVLFCISKDTQKNISKEIYTKDIQTFYNPFNFEYIKQLSLQNINFDENSYIIQIGSGFSRKRQDILLKAFSKISDKNIKLLLLGSNPYSEALDLICKLNIDRSRVIFHPFVENPYPYIKKAKLLVISSDREGLPRVMVEALSLDIPVVSTDCDTGPREILVDELSMYLAKVNDPNDLAIKMDKALISYPINLKKYLSEFEKDNISKQFVKYIENNIGEC